MPRGGRRCGLWGKLPELSDKLVELWNGGASASECAMKLGNGITRNAVLGRLMRLKESGVEIRHAEPRAPQPKKQRPSRARPKPISKPVPDYRTLEPLQLESGEFITALSAKDKHCRYSYGDAADPGFAYCGRDVRPGHSWCEAHCAVVYQPKHPATQEAEAAA